MDKVWKQTRFDNYMMSVDGEVMSLNYNKTGKHKILKLHKDKRGYCSFTVYINGKPKTISVHRLLWETFIGEIPENMVIDHINGDKSDNRLKNLHVVTQEGNVNNPNTRPRHVDGVRNARSKTVEQIDCNTNEIIKRWECISDVERELGINHSNLSQCCRGKYKTVGGFKWRYS